MQNSISIYKTLAIINNEHNLIIRLMIIQNHNEKNLKKKDLNLKNFKSF